jgi:hypothetical protein
MKEQQGREPGLNVAHRPQAGLGGWTVRHDAPRRCGDAGKRRVYHCEGASGQAKARGNVWSVSADWCNRPPLAKSKKANAYITLGWSAKVRCPMYLPPRWNRRDNGRQRRKRAGDPNQVRVAGPFLFAFDGVEKKSGFVTRRMVHSSTVALRGKQIRASGCRR